MAQAFIVQPDAGRRLDLDTFEVLILASGDGTSGELTVLLTRGEQPGFTPPLHVHRDAAEAFYVLMAST